MYLRIEIENKKIKNQPAGNAMGIKILEKKLGMGMKILRQHVVPWWHGAAGRECDCDQLKRKKWSVVCIECAHKSIWSYTIE